MEWSFGNYAALRQQIVASSPELRALESKLQACALTRDNRAAIAEKETHKKLMNMEDKHYAELVKQLDGEEQLSASLTLADQRTKKLENQKVLKEQIAEKAASKAEVEAEKTIEMMSEVDESKLLEREREEQRRKKQELHQNTRQLLLKQYQLKQLLQEESRLQEKHLERSAEEYNLQQELHREMERQQAELQRLHLNHRELALVKQLERDQMEKRLLQDTRLELEVLEKSAQEKKFVEDKERKEKEARLALKDELDHQVKYKKKAIAREHEQESEYRKLLFEVMAEEGRLEQLASGARRRRQLEHRLLVEHLLEERRALRAQAMKQHQEEEQNALQYNQLRKSILEEEEKHLLLTHAPHLMPYFTPELWARLRHLQD